MALKKTKHYEIWADNDVLVAVTFGQWSERTAKSYVKAFKEVVATFDGKRWAHCADLEQWQLATPESVQHINALEKWTIANGLACFAVVYQNDPLKDYVVAKTFSAVKDGSVYAHFEHRAHAYEWFRQLGFSPSEL